MSAFEQVFGLMATAYGRALCLAESGPLPEGHPAIEELQFLRTLRQTAGAYESPPLGKTAAALEHAALLAYASGTPLGFGRAMPSMGPLWPAFVPRLRSKERFLDTFAEVQTWLVLEDHGLRPRPVDGEGKADFVAGDGFPVENKVLHTPDPDRIADHVAKATRQVQNTGPPGVLFLNVGDDLALAPRRPGEEGQRRLRPEIEKALRRALEGPDAEAIDRCYLTWRWATKKTAGHQEAFTVHRSYKLVRAPRPMRTRMPNAFPDWAVEFAWKPFPRQAAA